MKFTACLFGLLAVSATARSTTGSPVERVVNLLKDLQTKVQNDGKVEEQIYNKYACWCEKTSERKGEAIEKAQDDLRALGQTILKLKGKVATLTAEIQLLAENIAANEAEQEAATNLRQKENEDFTAETTELKQAIAALQRATQVIVAGASQDSFLQTASRAVHDLLQVLPTHGRPVKADHVALLTQLARGKAKYAPQSATVQGILKDMYETFTNDLETSTDVEATANKNFENFIYTKTVELNEMKALKEKKEGQKAEAEAQLADTTQIYDDTEAQMNADIEFFDATMEACQIKAAEWKTRRDLRAEELRGIAKALEILTSDDARELFASSIKAGKETHMDASFDSGINIAPALLQLASESSAPAKAFVALQKFARKAHSLRLAALAARIQQTKVGHFDGVIKAIDEMMAALKEEDAADIAKRDQCKEQYTKTASVIANITWLIKNNVAKIDKLESLIEKATAEKEATIASIAETEALIVTMTEQRTAENQEFLHAKAEDVAAVELLMKARDVLAAYGKNNSIDMGPIQGGVKDAFVQGEPEFTVSADQAPDAVFSGQDKRTDESKGIVSIMTMLIEDLNDEISNGMKNEASAQMEFEKQLAAATKLKEDLITKKNNLEETIARLGEEKSDTHMLMEENQEDLNDEVTYKKSITPDCDWIIGAFEERAKKRTNELNGLVAAKELLAGMNPSTQAALLQSSNKVPVSPHESARKVRFLGLGA